MHSVQPRKTLILWNSSPENAEFLRRMLSEFFQRVPICFIHYIF